MTTSLFGVTAPGLARVIPLVVIFTGSTAIKQGQALCWDRTTGTATVADGDRDRKVATPSYLNNMNFAGVAARAYPAVAGGQPIEIYLPGSVCPVLANAAQTIGANSLLTFIYEAAAPAAANADVGKFRSDYASAFNGAGVGSARILQTIGATGLVLAELQQGPQVGGIEAFDMVATAVVNPTGTTVITRTTALSTAAMADGVYIGQRKTLVVTGAANFVTTIVLGASKGNRLGMASADGTTTGVDHTNFVVPVPGTLATMITQLVWTGTRWRTEFTNLLTAAFT